MVAAPAFIDRQAELRELNTLLDNPRPQLVVTHGRRRVGKTRLLLHWAEQTGHPFMYGVARREPPEAARRGLATVLWQWGRPGRDSSEIPSYGSWALLFEEMAQWIGSQRVIVILDEFPYAVEADPSLPSHLQAAWDMHLKNTTVFLVLAGSHIGMMVDLLNYDAPLYGRSPGQFPIGPLPFSALADFFPAYSPAERVATYAVIGGVPAYLERFQADRSLGENVRAHLFNRSGMFRNDPAVLIGELVRETRNYEAVVRAVAQGNHALTEIARSAERSTSHVPVYVNQLIRLGLLERRLPATVPPDERRSSKRGRYHLRDPYLRFYFRFIDPNLEMLEQGLTELLWERIVEEFRAYVGGTGFEELCREWVLVQARKGRLPFQPELVGSHWAPNAQVDVLAINWREKSILLGECKWGAQTVGRSTVRELVEKAPLVAPGKDWQIHYALFARSGFTDAARAEADTVGASLVDLETVDSALREAMTQL